MAASAERMLVRLREAGEAGGVGQGIYGNTLVFGNSALFKASSYLYHFHNVSPYITPITQM